MPAQIADGVQITVSIGFSTSAGAGTVPLNSTLTSITWTDVSTSVRDVSIKRGRSSELDDFATGSCQVTLSNADRRFDPENAAGPYFGRLTPGRPILIQATAPGDIAQTIFQGYVDQWNQQYVNPSDATVTVTASDAFKALNQIQLLSYWEDYLGSQNVSRWFRFADGDAPTTAFETVSGQSLGQWRTTLGVPTAGKSAASLVYGNSSTAASFDGSSYVAIPLESMPFNANSYTSKTLTFWMQSSTTTNGTYGIFSRNAAEFTIAAGMRVTSGVGVIEGQWGSVSGVNIVTAYTSAVTVNDGKPHLVTMNFSWPTGGELWVDGVKATTSATFSWLNTNQNDIRVGRSFFSDGPNLYGMVNNFVGVIDELAFFTNTVVPASTLYDIGNNGYKDSRPASEQITAALDMVDWMSDARSITTATATLQGMDTEGSTALAFLKSCEQADQGRLFVTREGLIGYLSHDVMATSSTLNTSQRTFGDGAGELPYTDLEFTYNDQLIYNRVQVARDRGATAIVDDTTSQGQYFIRSNNLSGLINDTDQQVDDIARVRLQIYKQPQLRIDRMTFTPRRQPSMYASTIADDIGTRITVRRRPQNVGAVISKELIIEGIEHRIGVDSWVTTYNLSPAPLNFLVLDNAVYGKLDSNYLGY